MALVKPKEDPLDVRIERVLVSQQEAVVLLAAQNGDYEGKVLPVFIDLGQAMNIQVGLEGRRTGRPLTHDLFTSVMNQLGANVDKIVIEEIAQNTFFATLHVDMERDGKRESVSFDARPSDCLALAVRAGASIKVRRKVFDAASVDRDKIIGQTQPGEPVPDEEEEEEEDEEKGKDKEPRKGKRPKRPPGGMDPSEFEKP